MWRALVAVGRLGQEWSCPATAKVAPGAAAARLCRKLRARCCATRRMLRLQRVLRVHTCTGGFFVLPTQPPHTPPPPTHTHSVCSWQSAVLFYTLRQAAPVSTSF